MHDTLPLLEAIPFPPIRRARLTTLQVNLGYRCNQACLHCHVNAGPNRTEAMSGETIDLVLAVLERRRIGTLDVTGGAPELHPELPPARRRGARPRRQGDRPLQPHDPARARPGGSRRVPRRPRGRGRRLAALLSRGQRRPAARQRRVRQEHRGAAAAQRASATAIRGTGRVAQPRLQSAGAEPAAEPGGAQADYKRMLCERTASSSTTSTPSPTCRSSASARR